MPSLLNNYKRSSNSTISHLNHNLSNLKMHYLRILKDLLVKNNLRINKRSIKITHLTRSKTTRVSHSVIVFCKQESSLTEKKGMKFPHLRASQRSN